LFWALILSYIVIGVSLIYILLCGASVCVDAALLEAMRLCAD
jgi:hypothetical protein